MELTSQGHSATLENIRMNLSIRLFNKKKKNYDKHKFLTDFIYILFSFPHMQLPNIDVIYDSLAQLMQERKIYQTAKGYFIVTPE